MAKMSYFNAAIENIEERFDIKIRNIKELECDSISIGALGYLIDDKIYLIAPTRSEFKKKNLPNGKKIGELVEIKGNFQDFNYSEIKKLGIPAVILKNNQLWFNATPFTNFQKWLQFEYSIVPYLNWYDRMFWLDEFANFLVNLIYKVSPENVKGYQLDNKTQVVNYVILRHDVDESRDLTYLNFELENNIPATYALLLDKNFYYWLNILKNKENIEIAFHFMTNEINIFDLLKIVLNKFFKKNFKIENLPIDWNKKPLWRQIRKFISKTDKVPFTIHRHYSFIKYPEFINELEKISSMFPEIIGSSSFFRATVLYHNLKCANGMSNGYYHFEPDVGSPFWWVFKVYNPITQNIVNIYEQCHIMEPDIELLTKIFSKRIKGIKKNLFTIGLHPAHSTTKNFNENGQIETLKYLYNIKEKFNIKNDILYSKLTENIVEIRCKNSQNNNELTTPSLSFVEKLKIIFDFFGNPYFPWNVYIRYKRNYYYNYRIFNDKKLADNFYKFYMDKINPKKNWNILDYGCGEGRVIGLLNQLGFKNIIGQDVYFFKRWEYYNANFVITPIRCNDFYPYKDNVFDAVFSIQVRMYLNDSQLKEHIFNISRILKKGGYFIFEDRNEFMINPKHYLQNKYCPYIHKRDRILELLKQNNFEIIEEKTFGIDTKYFPKFFGWLRSFLTPKCEFDNFNFCSKNWLDKLLVNYIPKGREPLHLIICRKVVDCKKIINNN